MTLCDAILDTDWVDWQRDPISQDASARSYWRLRSEDRTAILMQTPPDSAAETDRFLKMTAVLHTHQLCAPEILFQNTKTGVLILEDLGPQDFAQWSQNHPEDTSTLYKSALGVILCLEKVREPAWISKMTPEVAAEMLSVLNPVYTTKPINRLQEEIYRAFDQFCGPPEILSLRDFHAENLIWRPDRAELDRVGLLDYQDAILAPGGYDLVSLLRDARRDVPTPVYDEMTSDFLRRTRSKTTPVGLAVLAIQRNLRILGIFARLAKRDGKTKYLNFMPRVWEHIQTDAALPELSELRAAIDATLAPPDMVGNA